MIWKEPDEEKQVYQIFLVVILWSDLVVSRTEENEWNNAINTEL